MFRARELDTQWTMSNPSDLQHTIPLRFGARENAARRSTGATRGMVKCEGNIRFPLWSWSYR